MRRRARHRRGEGARVLREADYLLGSEAGHEDRAGGDLRAGARGPALRELGRGHRDRQRDHLRIGIGRLDPRYSTAHHWYAASCLVPLGRLDDAINELQVATALDPISAIIARDRALAYYYKRDFEAALEQGDHAIEINPYFSAAYFGLGLIQEQIGDFEEAVAAFQRALQLSPDSPRMHAALARMFAVAGRTREALAILDKLHEISVHRYVSPFDFAPAYFALGNEEKGYEWLARAFQDRSFELLSIRVDPRFDSLASDARFDSLCRQLL